ncbi:uncharacterized protein LOC113762099 [Coffea eugenioides]|uniref:uncharacterized protein LOC113762099 n=1 Tax=Coffea eugenioides TaxID=49369 RepID=UPI000F614885|nr:uncharacterized protein LOC113762099 [Coffea eugenioides]
MYREREKRNSSMEGEGQEGDQILEINLISAQGLKTPSGSRRRMHTYALAWVDPTAKLRTRTDRVGAENPTWNDKFLFRVSSHFLACETSGVTVEIYAVGYIRDYLIGTVRFLLSSCLGKFPSSADAIAIGTPAFTAVQIQRPSGRFHGVLNIAASVCSSACSDFEIFSGASAISFRDLVGAELEKEKEVDRRQRRRLSRIGSSNSVRSSGGESCDFDFSSLDLSSDGAESTTSSSSTASNALKEWNGVRTEVAQKVKEMKNKGGGEGLLCGLMLQRRVRFCQSDQNLRFWEESLES